jgi:hypothetical protein
VGASRQICSSDFIRILEARLTAARLTGFREDAAAALLRGRVGGGGARGGETAFRLFLRAILPRGEEGRREGGREGERNLLCSLARVQVHVPAVAAVAAVPDGLAIPLADGLAVAVSCGHHSLTLARSLAHSRTQGRDWRLSSLESQQARCVGSRW